MGTTWRLSVIHWCPLIPNNTHTVLGVWLNDQLIKTTAIQTEWAGNFLPAN